MCVFLPQEKKKKRMFKDKKRPIFNFVLKVGRMGNILPYLIVVSLFIGEGNGNPLQCSCLENPRDGGAWWADIYGVTQSRTRLKWQQQSVSPEIFPTCCLEGIILAASLFRSYMEGGKLSVSTVLKILISSLFHIILIFQLYPLNQRPSISTFLGK